MTKKQYYFRAIVYGLIKSLILFSMFEFYISKHGEALSIGRFSYISVFIALPPAIIYSLIEFRDKSPQSVFKLLLTAFVSFIAGIIIITILKAIVPFSLFDLRETNNADGIMLIMLGGFFIISSVAFEICFWAITIIWNKMKKQ